MSSPELERIRAAVPVDGAWLVGGSVRDLLLGRPVTDVDLVVRGRPGGGRPPAGPGRRRRSLPAVRAARRLAGGAAMGGRSMSRACRGGSIEADLGQRDFTVNAIAIPLAGGEPIDPSGGPRRPRGAQPAGGLRPGLRRRPAAAAAAGPDRPRAGLRDRSACARAGPRPARSWPTGPAGSGSTWRCGGWSGLDDPTAGVRLLDRMGVLEVVLPEIAPTRGVEQSPFHHLDVYEHTLQVLDTAADIAGHPRALPAAAGSGGGRGAGPARRRRSGGGRRAAAGGALPRHPKAADPSCVGRRPDQLHGPRRRGR